MTDQLLNLDLQNDRALARAEAASLALPEDLPRNPFAAPILDADEAWDEMRDRGQG